MVPGELPAIRKLFDEKPTQEGAIRLQWENWRLALAKLGPKMPMPFRLKTSSATTYNRGHEEPIRSKKTSVGSSEGCG